MTSVSPFEVLYRFPPYLITTTVQPTGEVLSTAFIKDRTAIRDCVLDALSLTRARIADVFDQNYKPIQLKEQVWLKIVCKISIEYILPNLSKLLPVKCSPFEIIQCVGKSVYKLYLLPDWTIYLIVSIIYLEQAHEDDFKYKKLNKASAPPVMVHGHEEHEVDQIIQIKTDEVLLHWKNGDQTWEPLGNVREDIPEMLKAYQKGQRRRRMLRRA